MLPDSVTFAMGSRPGLRECCEANISNDGLYEGQEEVTVVLSSEDATISDNIVLTVIDSEDLQGITKSSLHSEDSYQC